MLKTTSARATVAHITGASERRAPARPTTRQTWAIVTEAATATPKVWRRFSTSSSDGLQVISSPRPTVVSASRNPLTPITLNRPPTATRQHRVTTLPHPTTTVVRRTRTLVSPKPPAPSRAPIPIRAAMLNEEIVTASTARRTSVLAARVSMPTIVEADVTPAREYAGPTEWSQRVRPRCASRGPCCGCRSCCRATPAGRSLRSTTRSFIGMIALSVMWMPSGQTSVQHLVMLHMPRPAARWVELAPVVGVERVHVELGVAQEEARAGEGRLVVLVVTDDVAGVLAQEALDALAELLAALDVLLRHPALAVGVARRRARRRAAPWPSRSCRRRR